jgi:cytochrome oxidase Cu insertion factor (SCO1/SenC/PrrC family)
MVRLQGKSAMQPEVRLVSISVDPERDTPEVLAAYAMRCGADPDCQLLLTWPKDAIYQLAIEGFRRGVIDGGEQAQRGAAKHRTWLTPAAPWAHTVPKANRTLIHSSRFVPVTGRHRSGAANRALSWGPWSACRRMCQSHCRRNRKSEMRMLPDR